MPKTICVECRFVTLGAEADYYCTLCTIVDYVTGNKTHPYCYDRNDDGYCSEFKPKEPNDKKD